MTDERSVADRRTVLRRLGAVGAGTLAVSGVGSAGGVERADSPVQPAVARSRLAGTDALEALAAEGLLAEASTDRLSLQPRTLGELTAGREGVTRLDGGELDVVIAQRRFSDGRIRVIHDADAGESNAVVIRDGERSLVTDTGRVESAGTCQNSCEPLECSTTAPGEEPTYTLIVFEENDDGICQAADYDCVCSRF